MKIRIVTERYILDTDFWDWIRELNYHGIPIDGEKFIKNGNFKWTTDIGYTKATTRYEIIKGFK